MIAERPEAAALLGPHIDPPLAAIPSVLAASGLRVFQTTLRDPRRLSKEGVPDEADRAAYQAGLRVSDTPWGIAHASLLTSLGSPDPRIRNGSAGALVADANLAASIGLAGVCFHVGYQKGHDTRRAALDAVARKLGEAIGRLLLENGCEGTELGQDVEELAYVVRTVDAGPAVLGLVIDTCHLHVAGFDMAAPDAPARLAEELAAAGLDNHLSALHLNDARAPCGSHRDRHATPGEGTIGEGLRRLLAQPPFGGLPAVLEVSFEDALRGIAYLCAR